MLITEEIFRAFLRCETKAHLLHEDVIGDLHTFASWQDRTLETYKQQCSTQLRAQCPAHACLLGTSSLQQLQKHPYQFVFDCLLQTHNLQVRLHALERLPEPDKTHYPYIPVRFVPHEKVTKHDKLLLAFDALVLELASGKRPRYGNIIHGRNHKALTIQLPTLMNMVRSAIEHITTQMAQQTPPELVLNRHCPECVFHNRCRQQAIERDDLSLLAGMTTVERKRHHNRGIFSVTQLSYTFRARRKRKHPQKLSMTSAHALKARAIREHKIHLVGAPHLNLQPYVVFLDVEGIPDREEYYLIGLRIKDGDRYAQYAFWADTSMDEQVVWVECLTTLMAIEHPQLVYYGTYEETFLKQMKARYCDTDEHKRFVDQLLAESINILSIISTHVYFPTFSNGLKDIAQYLGFHWSHPHSSGLSALVWRAEWEHSSDVTIKQRLFTYNAEDCAAVEHVTTAILQLYQHRSAVSPSEGAEVVLADSLPSQNGHRFQVNRFVFPELDAINQAAYWDYQRDKVYIRSSQRLKQVVRKRPTSCTTSLPANTVITYPPLDRCPTCGCSQVIRQHQRNKLTYDLKFGHGSLKRWIVKHVFHRYRCSQCNRLFDLKQQEGLERRYGPNILAYITHQMIELRIPQTAITEALNQLFHFPMERTTIHRQKAIMAQRYKDTYERIIKRIVSGQLVHADETKVTIQARDEYVWVITNLEEVAYFHTETREGDKLYTLLKDFQGVVVSDFYAAYDSLTCRQQKCLIHLIRDMNEDIRKEPFNEELKALVQDFAQLLKVILETVDRFGLKARFLRKHKGDVERFYTQLLSRVYSSEIARKYQKRFEKNRDKLFTFLDHDGVPWNNNNAEHAVKAFAMLRRVIRATSTKSGIDDYLILLSVCETCRCKGVNFFDFLCSEERDIDVFLQKQKYRPKGGCIRGRTVNLLGRLPPNKAIAPDRRPLADLLEPNGYGWATAGDRQRSATSTGRLLVE